MRSIVGANTGALRGTLFIKINPDSVSPADNLSGIYSVSPERIDCRLPNHMGRELRNIGNIDSEIRKRNSHIGLRSAESKLHIFRLHKALIMIRLQAQHHFSETNYLCHEYLQVFPIDFCLKPSDCLLYIQFLLMHSLSFPYIPFFYAFLASFIMATDSSQSLVISSQAPSSIILSFTI